MSAASQTVLGHLRDTADRTNDHDHDPTDVFRQVRRPSVIAHPRPVLAHPRPVLAHPRLIPRPPRVPRGTEPPPAPVERRRLVTPADLDFDEESTTMPSLTYVRPGRALTG